MVLGHKGPRFDKFARQRKGEKEARPKTCNVTPAQGVARGARVPPKLA
jgi:hypothetical protein